MSYTAKQKSYVEQFRDDFITANRLPQDNRLWSLDTRNAYNAELAEYIETNPQIFEGDAIEAARQVTTARERGLETFGFTGGLETFFGEFVAQGQAINPLSDQNRVKFATSILATGGMVVLGIYLIHKYKP